MSSLNRFTTLLLGGALGDAIGLSCEFIPTIHCHRLYPNGISFTVPWIRDTHRAKFPRGSWTDDTDQALCILLCTMSGGGPKEFANWLKVWIHQGLRCLDKLPLGIGQSTGKVVTADGYVDNPFGVAYEDWRTTGRVKAPNGSLMRTWVIGSMGFLKGKTEDSVVRDAVDFGRVTHADERCIVSTVLVSVLVYRMFQGGDLDVESLLDQYATPFLDYYHDRSTEEVSTMKSELYKWCRAATFAELDLDNHGGMGYVYRTLGAAILSLKMLMNGQGNYESIISELCLCGGDADTNAVVAGALMGCYLGDKEALPHAWLQHLKNRDWLEKKAEQFCILTGAVDGTYSADDDLLPDGGKGYWTKEEADAAFKHLFKESIEPLFAKKEEPQKSCAIQ